MGAKLRFTHSLAYPMGASFKWIKFVSAYVNCLGKKELMMDEAYMRRCLELAVLAEGHVAPNPLVGALLLHNNRIIAEGYHQQFGKAHAEVNCLAAVSPEDKPLIAQSTLYVSLEPCAHYGKTPPCADLIIQNKIPKVVVGCRDPFVEVDGKGIDRLRAAGVEVVVGTSEKECIRVNRRFFRFHLQKRPYIILKWAETEDGKIAGINNQRTAISNEYSKFWVHKWRAEESAILVGTNTALQDDPALTLRHWPGIQPLRVSFDLSARLPHSLQIFDGRHKTLLFTSQIPEKLLNGLQVEVIENSDRLIPEMLAALHRLRVLSVLVEGGAATLQSFINLGLWDECIIIRNEHMRLAGGLPAPILSERLLQKEERPGSDHIRYYLNPAFL